MTVKVVFREEKERRPIREEDKYRTLESLAAISGVSVDRLTSSLVRGEIEGLLIGDCWLSTIAAVSAYTT